MPVPIKITNQVVSKVNHFSKTTDTKKAQCHLQKHLLSLVEEVGDMILSHFRVNHFSKTADTKKAQFHLQKYLLSLVEEMGDMILSHFPVTLMIIMAFSLITDTGKVIAVLDLVIGIQYKMWVCIVVVPIKAHIKTEVEVMIEASISNAVVSLIPTMVSSTNIVDGHRMVDKAKEGMCNFIGIPNITLPSPQGLTACPMLRGAFSLLIFIVRTYNSVFVLIVQNFLHGGPLNHCACLTINVYIF